MRRAAWLSAAVMLAFATTGPACGPACLDDRCSIKTAAPRVDRFERPAANPDAGTSTSITTTSSTDAGSGSAIAAQGSAGSAAQGSGAIAAAPAAKVDWIVFDNLADNTRILVVTKDEVPAGTTVKFDFTKLPDKTPFAMRLEVKKAGGATTDQASWNECPTDKLRCDVAGTKSYVTKQPGRISLQARTNWAITGFVGDAAAYLVTWTNTLTRDSLTIRLAR